jgi:hypothetical protein
MVYRSLHLLRLEVALLLQLLLALLELQVLVLLLWESTLTQDLQTYGRIAN